MCAFAGMVEQQVNPPRLLSIAFYNSRQLGCVGAKLSIVNQDKVNTRLWQQINSTLSYLIMPSCTSVFLVKVT